MKTNIVPLLSKEITFNALNKNEYFIHQTVYDHRIKISSELYNFIKLIDNQKELKSIVYEYNLKYKSNLTYEFSYGLLYNKLALYGIIKCDAITIKPNQKPNYIKLNFIVISEKTVSRFTKHLHFLFKPLIIKSIVLTALLILLFCFYNFNYEIFNANILKSDLLFFFYLEFHWSYFSRVRSCIRSTSLWCKTRWNRWWLLSLYACLLCRCYRHLEITKTAAYNR